jgi:hypothetical protein
MHCGGVRAMARAPALLVSPAACMAATPACVAATPGNPPPLRFEPCGLVDIEFGWNGGLAIGHNTGGLGKMPG